MVQLNFHTKVNEAINDRNRVAHTVTPELVELVVKSLKPDSEKAKLLKQGFFLMWKRPFNELHLFSKKELKRAAGEGQSDVRC